MGNIYINIAKIVYVEETDLGVVVSTDIEDVMVTEDIREVMASLDDDSGVFVCLTRFDPTLVTDDPESDAASTP